MTVEVNRIRAWGKTQARRAHLAGGGAGPPPFAGGEESGSSAAIGPILTDLDGARADVVTNTGPTDITAKSKLDAAIAKINALTSEDSQQRQEIIAEINSAKVNIDLVTAAGDTAALNDIDNAKRLVNSL